MAEVRTPLVGMYFLMRRVVALARGGYEYAVHGGFALLTKQHARERRLAL